MARVGGWTRALRSLGVSGGVGLVILVAILLFALIGPLASPHDPSETLGSTSLEPSRAWLLGTDFLGRDILSRLCWGGQTVLLLAGAATLLAYAGGLSIGLIAGYTRSWIDPLLMRGVDVLLSVPALVFLLLVVTAVGSGRLPLVVGVAIVQVPGVARIIRSATLAQSVRGYVESAVARGESTLSVLRREILPNIKGPIAADIGLRMASSIILMASVNFLGLGLQPPTSDWGLMIAENRGSISLNPWAIIAPGVLIALLVIALNLLGDAIATRASR